MKTYLASLSIFFVLLGCAENNPEEQLKNLNGYWEIKQVENPNGKTTDYKFNEQVDFIELRDTLGFRTKVLPRIDGTFVTTDSKENIVAIIKNDSLYLNYTTPFDSWSETVLIADGNELQLKNDRGLIYTYHKFEKIDITD
ncbi:lipocalin family protein [Leeuwenhoekiella sp. MAR_2009_132]|uniref:lipocalin family protein n=1 Tax=Leeuwenhoekiella sp. MAR_2009_132 TaxID=1392489 RepID=UPI00056017A1|nr:lipocalin family protein [Leeuwenhoekiella sp. MAR_2009_132]